MFDAAAATKAWKKISNYYLDREGTSKARYLRHMSAVLTERERREWDFLFEDEEVKRARMLETKAKIAASFGTGRD